MADVHNSGILLESGTNEIEIMEFTINGNLYGINVAKVREIIMSAEVKAMPHAHPAVEGIFKPRDEVLTVVDLPRYLNGGNGEKGERDIFIITNFNKMFIAFRVHSVVQISRISWTDIQKPDKAVSGGAEAAAFLRRTAVDLLFLDIEMEDVSGFDLARHIQSAYPKILIVFLTGHVDFALDGYEFKPLAFLIKPVNPLRLERVLFQAEELLGKTERKPSSSVRIGLQVNGGLEIIQVDSILYIEKQGRRACLVPASGPRYQSYDSLQKLQGIFELYGFFRCHQSFLVRLDAIRGVRLDESRSFHKILLFDTEDQIPLSRGKYPELRERLADRGLTIL